MINHRSKGACGARNTGIFVAKGKWVAFLDDDDAWLPDKLEYQYELAQNVDEMVSVSEESIISATRFLLYRMKLVAEPSGAVGLAALLSKEVNPEGKIGIIVSGGNIDDLTMTKILNYTNDL